MAKKYLFWFCVFLGSSLQAQVVNIPDANFKALLLLAGPNNEIAKNNLGQNIKVDVNNNGQIELSEALSVVHLDIWTPPYNSNYDIASTEGLASFTNLKSLDCGGNLFTTLDVSMLTQLTGLQCESGNLTSLNVTGLTQLERLYCFSNDLTQLDVTGLTSLKYFWCWSNNLTSLNFTGLSALNYIVASENQLTSVVLGSHPNLNYLDFASNQLTDLDVSGLPILGYLDVTNNLISSLNIQPFVNTLTHLYVGHNPMPSLSVSGFMSLTNLNVSGTLIPIIDCSQSGLQQLGAVNCPNLKSINVRNGIVSYSDPDLLYFAFRVESNPQLVSICTDDFEQNNLAFFNYNTSGNVVVYNGPNCDIPVQVNMSTDDFDKNAFSLYPNPTADFLHVKLTATNVVKEVSVHSVLGQKLRSESNTTTIDVSSLSKGTYLIKVETANGIATQQFVKL